MIIIRDATLADRDPIHQTHLSAFPEEENQLVADLAVNLLAEQTTPETLSLVAEVETEIVGHIAFSPVSLDTDKHWQGYILAPLGIKPECQKTGLGGRLIEAGIEQLSQQGVDVLFVYGDPEYYGRFGFKSEIAGQYMPPYRLEQPLGWQAICLNKKSNLPSGQLSCVECLCKPELW